MDVLVLSLVALLAGLWVVMVVAGCEGILGAIGAARWLRCESCGHLHLASSVGERDHCARCAWHDAVPHWRHRH